KNVLIKQIEQLYVSGRPRVWWLSLKYEPTNFTFNDNFQYKRISNFFDYNEKVYLIVEADSEKLVFVAPVEIIIKLIGESPFFEYYILNMDLSRMLCETDHGDLLL